MGSGDGIESEGNGMIIVVKVKDTDNIIGLKEDIAARLEDMVDVEKIGVFENGSVKITNHRKDGTP